MADNSTIKLSFVDETIAVLTFDMPDKGANVLSQAVLDELDAQLTALESRQGLRGLILCSAKPGIFIAGADLREFIAGIDASRDEMIAMCRRGQTLFQRLSQSSFVTVAAIDGLCLGGGAELAIWCDRRLMTTDGRTQFGFPEVKLGLMPGWGGTARTPRIVGLANAVEMVTGGESISGAQAYSMGLVTQVSPSDRLMDAAVALVNEEHRTEAYRCDREGWSAPIRLSETELGFLGVTANGYIQQQTKGQYPAPPLALETMLEGSTLEIDAACQCEAARFSELFGTATNRALLNVFFLTDRNKKDKGVDVADVVPRAISSAGVVGAGIMGAGIVAANLKRGLSVTLYDAATDALSKGAERALGEAAYDRQQGQVTTEKLLQLAPKLHSAENVSDFEASGIVIEAVVENEAVKQKVLASLEQVVGNDTILASNTSTIPITKLAKALRNPERFCGVHFFNPVRKMKLVEVIRGDQTSDETVATAVGYAKRLGKHPIVVSDGPGFLVNRLLLPYMNEALELLCEGASIDDIERAAKSFGMPMGPITLYDVVGLDTALYAGQTMWEAFPDRIVANPLLPALVKQGRLGQKSGRGFFLHQGGKSRGKHDPDVEPILAQYRRGTQTFTKEQLEDRLFLPMLLEATRILEERLVRNVRDVDLGLIFGVGFPPFKGGLLFWADAVGIPKILERLKPLEAIGNRGAATPLLLELAREGRSFYELD